MNYSVIITETTAADGEIQVARKTLVPELLSLPVDLDFSAELTQDREYQLYVNACISIACRSTSRVPFGKCMHGSWMCVNDGEGGESNGDKGETEEERDRGGEERRGEEREREREREREKRHVHEQNFVHVLRI